MKNSAGSPMRVLLPRTQEELAECLELDKLGLVGHGDVNPTLEQIADYEAREEKLKKLKKKSCSKPLDENDRYSI